jgi:hypothetical protein
MIFLGFIATKALWHVAFVDVIGDFIGDEEPGI